MYVNKIGINQISDKMVHFYKMPVIDQSNSHSYNEYLHHNDTNIILVFKQRYFKPRWK